MSIEARQVYRCEICGNIIEVLEGGGPEPECCGDTMTLLEENTTDAAKEKHVPVVEKVDGGYQVTVGSVAHPMEDAHLIQWIELLTERGTYRHELKPGEPPVATFKVDAEMAAARAWCNLHGLWKA